MSEHFSWENAPDGTTHVGAHRNGNWHWINVTDTQSYGFCSFEKPHDSGWTFVAGQPSFFFMMDRPYKRHLRGGQEMKKETNVSSTAKRAVNGAFTALKLWFWICVICGIYLFYG